MPLSIGGADGRCRLKPIVEINPRFTMGRVTLEILRQAAPGCSGLSPDSENNGEGRGLPQDLRNMRNNWRNNSRWCSRANRSPGSGPGFFA